MLSIASSIVSVPTLRGGCRAAKSSQCLLRQSFSRPFRSPPPISPASRRWIMVDAKKRKLNPATVKKLEHQLAKEKPEAVLDPNKAEAPRKHVPVLLDEVLKFINPHAGGLYVDTTFGMGGHSRAILKTEDTTVFGLDRDVSVLKMALESDPWLASTRSEKKRLRLIHGRFSQMFELLKPYEGKIDGILMDIGVSSVQIDTAERGFSYREDKSAKLDMRMDQSSSGPTAYDLVNSWSESRLADLILKYGEDRNAKRIAHAIVSRREKKAIETTADLASIISSCIPRGSSAYLSPQERLAEHAKRTFQALRIEVNQELQELKEGLVAAEKLLRPGGRLLVISFHSLEDKIVKSFFNIATGKPIESHLHPELQDVVNKLHTRSGSPSSDDSTHSTLQNNPTFDKLIQKASTASSEELDANKRARPAKLRVAVRTSAKPHDWTSFTRE